MTDRHQEPKDENPNLDPNPDYDNDLEGGGVKRGHTPPESQSASTPPSHTPSRRPPRRNPTLVIIGILLVFMVLFFRCLRYRYMGLMRRTLPGGAAFLRQFC